MNDLDPLPNKKKSILIDISFLFDQYSRRGIGVYGRNIIKRLIYQLEDQQSEYDIYLIGFGTLEQNLIELGYSQFRVEDLSRKLDFFSIGTERDSSIKNFTEWSKTYKLAIESSSPDVYYAVHFERGLPTVPSFAKKLKKIPKTIVVVHDVIPLATNKFSSKGFIQNWIKKKFYMAMWKGVQNADMVITATKFSRKDLIRYGKLKRRKIKVISLGVNNEFRIEKESTSMELAENTLEAYSLLNKPYFFYDSGVEPNKGILHLLNTFKEILKLKNLKLPNYLVIIGKDFYKGEGDDIKPRSLLGEEFLALAKKLGVSKSIITTDKISEEHLITLLANASVYMNMSTYEGFGLGIAQAMATGIPVIASNSSCYPEVTNGGAYLVDIEKEIIDYSEIAKGIETYLADEEAVQSKVKKSLEISLNYNWNITVRETFNTIKEVIKS
jgi:glycosyltransferase involved in cell wall biosynthesis